MYNWSRGRFLDHVQIFTSQGLGTKPELGVRTLIFHYLCQQGEVLSSNNNHQTGMCRAHIAKKTVQAKGRIQVPFGFPAKVLLYSLYV